MKWEGSKADAKIVKEEGLPDPSTLLKPRKVRTRSRDNGLVAHRMGMRFPEIVASKVVEIHHTRRGVPRRSGGAMKCGRLPGVNSEEAGKDDVDFGGQKRYGHCLGWRRSGLGVVHSTASLLRFAFTVARRSCSRQG